MVQVEGRDRRQGDQACRHVSWPHGQHRGDGARDGLAPAAGGQDDHADGRHRQIVLDDVAPRLVANPGDRGKFFRARATFEADGSGFRVIAFTPREKFNLQKVRVF